MNIWPERIVIVGEPAKGLTKILQSGLVERLGGKDKVSILDIYKRDDHTLFISKPDLVFFVLDQQKLFEPANGPLHARKPIPVVRTMWDLLNNARDFPVHIAVPERSASYRGFTALDILAFCLSGVSGIWEIGITFRDETPENWLDVEFLRVYWNQKRIFLYGRTLAARLFEFWDRILSEDWPFSPERPDDSERPNIHEPLNDSVRAACFSLALGIAGLRVEELKIRAGNGGTIDSFAQYLLDLQDYTGCHMGRTVIPKHIGRLERGWKERIPRYHKNRRFEMPLWAQADGFPNQFPIVRGYKPHETSELLFSALDWIDFARDWEPEQDRFHTTIGLTPKLWRR